MEPRKEIASVEPKGLQKYSRRRYLLQMRSQAKLQGMWELLPCRRLDWTSFASCVLSPWSSSGLL